VIVRKQIGVGVVVSRWSTLRLAVLALFVSGSPPGRVLLGLDTLKKSLVSEFYTRVPS